MIEELRGRSCQKTTEYKKQMLDAYNKEELGQRFWNDDMALEESEALVGNC